MRRWIVARLKRYFKYVYLPLTQPWHEEFPLDWSAGPSEKRLTRAVFIAARGPLSNPLLSETIPNRQVRH